MDMRLGEVLRVMLRYSISHVVVTDSKTGKPVTVVSKNMILSELLGTEVIRGIVSTL